jgi:hypothetical protein
MGVTAHRRMDEVRDAKGSARHTLMSIFLALAGSMVGKAHGLKPDEWGRANRALPWWDLKRETGSGYEI